LFFHENTQLCLLLGRREKEQSNVDKSDYSSEKSENQNKLQKAEKDDDSPYFLKIILDKQFFSYLEDPNIYDPAEITESNLVDVFEN
jgi:hypothetical protein